jgi:hypothetical protein
MYYHHNKYIVPAYQIQPIGDYNMQRKDTPSTGDYILSNLVRAGNIWLWADGTIYSTYEDTVNPPPSELPLPEKNPNEYASLVSVALRSQLRFCKRNEEKIFAYDADLQAIEACPVILASTLSYPENVTKVERRSPYPPPEHGTAAAISEQTYHITDLPKEAQERQKQISKMLEHLPTQPTETPESFVYPACPEELKNMIQQLAQDYYQHHQHVNIDNKPIPSTVDAFNAERVARMLSAYPVQAYSVAATAPLTAWEEYMSDKENELIMRYPLRKKNGNGISHVMVKEDITGRDRALALKGIKESIERMGDYDSDLYMMMILQLIVDNRNALGNITMTRNRVLDYHATKDRRTSTEGIHDEEWEKWSNAYYRMRNKWISLEEIEIFDDSQPKKQGTRARTTISREGPLFMFGEEIRHNTLPMDGKQGKSTLVAWEYRESSWLVPFIQGSNAYTGSIMQDCFMFDPYHEKWEKRLSKHFFFWLRTNAQNQDKASISIRELFEKYDLQIDRRNPQRTRERFERAMNVLAGKEPRIIGSKDILIPHLKWTYANGFDPKDLPSRKWLETWLSQKICVDLPNEQNPYKHIEDAVKARQERQELAKQKAFVLQATKRKKGRPPGSKNKK